jgi:hypothetical protein
MMFVNLTFIVWQVTASLPSIYAQAITLFFFSSARQFLYAFFFAGVGSTFGYDNFGSVFVPLLGHFFAFSRVPSTPLAATSFRPLPCPLPSPCSAPCFLLPF